MALTRHGLKQWIVFFGYQREAHERCLGVAVSVNSVDSTQTTKKPKNLKFYQKSLLPIQ